MFTKILKKNLIFIIVGVIIVVSIGYYFYARKFAVLPDAAVNLMETVHEPTSTDRVLIISPHFDDETIAAGGYIQRAVEKKSDVKIVVVTDGNRRGVGAERHKEFVEVTKTLGVGTDQLKFLDLPEYYLKEKIGADRLNEILNGEIIDFKPTVLIYPDASDTNPDHTFIGTTLNEIIKGRTDLFAYSYLVHWQYFPQPVGLHPGNNLTPPVKLLDFSHRWQRFDLGQGEEDTKLSALLIYKTQLRIPFLHDLLVSMVRKNELFSVH